VEIASAPGTRLRPGALLLPLLFALSMGCRRRDPGPPRQNNALWSESLYFRGEHPTKVELRPGFSAVPAPKQLTDEIVVAFVRRMGENGIRYPFLFAGPYDLDGELPAYGFSERAQRSLAIIHQHAPQAIPLPWVGGLEGKQLRLEDPRWVDRAVASAAALVERLGVAGLHVDFEYVLFGTRPDPELRYPSRVNDFLRKLRARLPHAFLSTVVPSTAPDVIAWKMRHTVDEVAELAPRVDQLAVLFYDTHIRDPKRFESNLVAQLEHIERWRRVAPQTQYLVSLGTFVNPGPELQAYRDPRVENIPHFFAALRAAMRKVPGGVPDGVAIYCEWETDDEEWAAIRREWTGLAAPPASA
jgi:hypothetical protein